MNVNPRQTRVQRRLIVRISPARPREQPKPRTAPQLVERKMGKCVNLKDVVAVQTRSSSKLVLYLRNRTMISAQLEKSCRARDFYSGFYVEPSKDGKLCIKRDELQSRNGAKCEVTRFRKLEPVGS